MVMQAVPLQHMEVHGGADIHTAAYGGPNIMSGGNILKEAAVLGNPMPELAFCWELQPVGVLRWSMFILNDCTPWKATTLEQFLKNCSLWEGPTCEQFMKDCLPWEGPCAGAGKQHEEEGAA